jgi:hypothetical protein
MASDSHVMASFHQLRTYTFHKGFLSCITVSKNDHISRFVTRLIRRVSLVDYTDSDYPFGIFKLFLLKAKINLPIKCRLKM